MCTCLLIYFLPRPERQTSTRWNNRCTQVPPPEAEAPLGPLTCMGACFKALVSDSEWNFGLGAPQALGRWEQPPFVVTVPPVM